MFTNKEIEIINGLLMEKPIAEIANLLNESRPVNEKIIKDDIILFFQSEFQRDIFEEKFGRPYIKQSPPKTTDIFYTYANGIKIPREISEIKDTLKQVIKTKFMIIKHKLTAITPSGIEIGSTSEDLILFNTGQKINAPFIKDANNTLHEATDELYEEIIHSIEVRGLEILQKKWTLEKQLQDIETFNDLIDLKNMIEIFEW